MKRLAVIAAILAMAPLTARAISDSAGTSAGAFLKIPTDARGVALGRTMVSMAEGSEGLRWNPAALGTVDTNEFSTTHIEYYQDVTIENITYANPTENGAIAANLFYLSPGDLDGRDLQGNPTGNFKFYDLVGGVGYGRRIRTSEEGLETHLGAQIKMVQEKIADTQYLNPAVDLGLLIMPMDYVRVGFTLRDLSTGRANFPKEFTGGASYTMYRVFTAGLALTYADDAAVRVGLSGECRFPELENSVVRVGYQSHDAMDDSTDAKITFFRNASLAGLTLGGGMELRPAMFKSLHFQMDYGMAPFGALGISHTITLKIKW